MSSRLTRPAQLRAGSDPSMNSVILVWTNLGAAKPGAAGCPRPYHETMDLRSYSPALRRRIDGVWAADHAEEVSYPASGHHDCLEIETSSFWFQHRNACIAALVDRFPPAGPIFDLGGGNGVVARALAIQGWSVVLVEPGEAGCQNAVARGVRDTINATFEGAAFVEGVLPAVGLFDVIEHIDDDAAFLRAVGSKMELKGTLYATVPAFRWLWSFDDNQAGHFRRYTKSGMINALQTAGFRPRYVSYLFAPLPLGIFLFRVLPYRLGLLRKVSPHRTAREHNPGAVLERILAWFLRIERGIVPNGQIPFGSSILVAAEWLGVSADRSTVQNSQPG